jgi:regulator of sirC expression with transglutaminase-like and TPR domain
MSRRSELLETLRGIGAGEDAAIDLADTALLLASLDRPEVEIEPYRDHLASLSAETAAKVTASPGVAMQVSLLRKVLVQGHGYHGDKETYEDVRNANLIDVIDRRKGLPVALGILYIHAARAYGSNIVGLNFPTHFLVRIEARGQRAIVDPFHDGKLMVAQDLRKRLKTFVGPDAEIGPAHYTAVGDRDILVRLQNNIKLRAVRDKDLPRALEVLETMTSLAPQRTELWWETAVLHHRLGNLKTAITLLEEFLAGENGDGGMTRIEDLLRQLRAQMN